MPPASPMLNIDTPFFSKGPTARSVIAANPELKKAILEPWPKPLENVRDDFVIIDWPAFGYHKWFRDFYALPNPQKTAETFMKAVSGYVGRRHQYLFILDKNGIARFKCGIKSLTDWCRTEEDGDFAIKDAAKVVRYTKWYEDNRIVSLKGNKPSSMHQYDRRCTGYWTRVMEIQGWYDYKPGQSTKRNEATQLTKDPIYQEVRATLLKNANRIVNETVRTVGESRMETKTLQSDDVERFIEYFNLLEEYKNTNNTRERADPKWDALTDYAILAFNFNIGFRGMAASNVCYSWFKYVEVKATVEGLYLNIGNPKGHKRRGNHEPINFAQFIVRHEDPRQCTIGTLIRLLVAQHDILRDTSLFDMIEKDVTNLESFVSGTLSQIPDPKWYEYRVIRSYTESFTPVSSTRYAEAIHRAYDSLGIDHVKAIAHEPHNRVPNNMQAMGVPNDSITIFNAWQNANNTEFERLYRNAGIDLPAALARSNHRHWAKNMYICPRDGTNDDFTGFEDVRALVLKGRIPMLLKRARDAQATLRQKGISRDQLVRLRTTVIFLEMVETFLIRVWLEDAAILYRRYPKSICYKRHPVFRHPKWPSLVAHLDALRAERGDIFPLVAAEGDAYESPASASSPDEFKKLLRKRHFDVTLHSLYEWRANIKSAYDTMHPNNKGIPDKEWKDVNAKHNQNLYQRIARICTYIDNVAKNKNWTKQKVMSKLEMAAKQLDLKIRLFAETEFRRQAILSDGEKSAERPYLKASEETFQRTLREQGLPFPFP
jgi:hypothetical protein